MPTHHEVRQAKLYWYPNDIIISETLASSNLQNLLDHTFRRILNLLDLDLLFKNLTSKEAICCFKAGFDGASSQSIHCQPYVEENLEDAIKNEETLLQTALVPLKISFDDRTLWQNETPNSASFCRPIKLQFKKETKEVCREEGKLIRDQFSNLNPLFFDHNGTKYYLKYNMFLTMLDNKAISALTNTNCTQQCNVCEMNKVNLIREKPVDQDKLKLGLSTLHCWIRTFEYLLHIAYKIEIKSFLANTQILKDSVKARKNVVRKLFRSELNLVVDMPKQGFGNSNSGNTARRAFADSSKIF